MLATQAKPIFDLRLFAIIQIWHHFKAQTFLWYFLTPTSPINTLSINFAQLIVNLENDIMELDFASKFNNMTS